MLELLLSLSWNADVVYPGMTVTDATLTSRSASTTRRRSAAYRLQDAPYISGAALIRRETAIEVGGYRNLNELEDWDLWVRMWRAGARFKACPKRSCSTAATKTAGTNASTATRTCSSRPRADRARQRVARPPPAAPIRSTTCRRRSTTRDAGDDVPALHAARALPARRRTARTRSSRDRRAAALPRAPRQGRRVPARRRQVGAAFQAVAMRDNGVRVLVETDDNYLTSPGKQIRDRQQWGKQIGDGRAHSAEGHRWIVEQADGVIVTTEFLAKPVPQDSTRTSTSARTPSTRRLARTR
jgi:hypothetical protein